MLCKGSHGELADASSPTHEYTDQVGFIVSELQIGIFNGLERDRHGRGIVIASALAGNEPETRCQNDLN